MSNDVVYSYGAWEFMIRVEPAEGGAGFIATILDQVGLPLDPEDLGTTALVADTPERATSDAEQRIRDYADRQWEIDQEL